MVATGVGRELKSGNDLAILTIGTAGNFAAEAIANVEQEGKLSIAHYDLRFAKPLDEKLIAEVAAKFDKVITVEDGVLRGGVGEAVVKSLYANGFKGEVRTLGIEDKFIEHGTPAELYSICGYDAEGIARTINQMLV
jgi:1-deoxy-D-xylulose-5-phosphate synthase